LPDIVLTSAPHLFDLGMDSRTFVFTMGLAMVSTLLFGMAPALRAAMLDLNGALKDGVRGSGSPARSRIRSTFVVAEIAISLVILITAGLLVRSFANLQAVDLGFRQDHVATLTVSLPEYRYGDAASQRQYFERALASVEQVSGVQSAGFVNVLPFSTYNGDTPFSVDDAPPVTTGQTPMADYRVATPGYFNALGMALRAGRMFGAQDRSTSAPVAIINDTLARRAFSHDDPVGRRIRVGGGDAPWRTIIGVVGDVRHSAIDEQPGAEVFLPFEQAPQSTMMLAVRTVGEPEAATPAIVQALATVDAAQPVDHVAPLRQLVRDAMVGNTWTMSLVSGLGLLAVLLATIGIYGVVSYAVNQRRREFGVRLALGAAPRDMLRLVLRSSGTMIAAGAAAGVVGALAAGRVMTGLLYGVQASDTGTFAVASAALIALALIACLIPARRAMRTDPALVLRGD